MKFHYPPKDFPPAGLSETLVDDLYDMVRVVSYKGGQTARGMLPYFDETVEQHGWSYRGPRRNRNRTIHDLVTGAFYAHRSYEQMTTWAALELYPYWCLNLYGSFDKSPFWTALDKKIIPANCEWAKMYWIRGNNNSFGFQVVSEARLERTGEQISEEPSITFYQGIDPVTGKLVETPLGIEPGFYKAITSPLEDYVKHFIRLAMVLPVSEEEEWY